MHRDPKPNMFFSMALIPIVESAINAHYTLLHGMSMTVYLKHAYNIIHFIIH